MDNDDDKKNGEKGNKKEANDYKTRRRLYL